MRWSERADDVLDVEHAPGAVEADADGVEADAGVAADAAPFRHPGGRQAADAELLAPVDREHGALGTEGRPGAAGLDLDEDERLAVEGHDVELAIAGSCVALEELPVATREASRDELLRGAADALPLNGHRSRT